MSSDSIAVKFMGKNYSALEFQFRLFVMGKELWGHIEGSDQAPTAVSKLTQWQTKYARVMTWILGSVDPIIVLNLRPYKTAKSMWAYLKKVYNQENIARRSQLEYEIAGYTQGDLSIQDYFSGFNNIWGEFIDIIYAKVPEESLSVVQEIHAQSKRDQFLMRLRPKFEATRSNLMNRNPVPSLDVCFGELLCEEQRITTQATYQHDKMISNAVAYVAQGKGKGRDMRKVQCFNCKEYGHIATNYTRKSCNYYKKPGHIIKERPTRPQNRQANAYQATVDSASSATTSDSSTLTIEKVQQMIIFTFLALGLHGNGSLSPSWIIDLGASNHMTSSFDTLSNVRTYTGSTHIQIANGCQLHIHAIGDVDSTIRDVFVSPQLSTSLISVEQLVDNNCDVYFSRDGCLVQDQVLGKILAKGPTVGRLFPMHFSIPAVISFTCNTVNNKCEV
ncbi:hypothetical protein Pint_19762 [Pistacia integerrima]|uniref:Uncharacterized protein n=1 Tax=Pistacia integerrima TaxID=434235 RepID=A0ACC0XB86_9ROSI|nr:hypothetical protein Pint_19762 [Pistacia integerrima]